jgi:hypothetical protein
LDERKRIHQQKRFAVHKGKPGETEKQKGLEVASKAVQKPRDQDDQGGIKFAGRGPV